MRFIPLLPTLTTPADRGRLVREYLSWYKKLASGFSAQGVELCVYHRNSINEDGRKSGYVSTSEMIQPNLTILQPLRINYITYGPQQVVLYEVLRLASETTFDKFKSMIDDIFECNMTKPGKQYFRRKQGYVNADARWMGGEFKSYRKLYG